MIWPVAWCGKGLPAGAAGTPGVGSGVVALGAGANPVTPTLWGRIQTRLLLGSTLGVVWTALVTPVLPHPLASDMGMNGGYGMVMTRLMTMISTGQRSTLAMDYQMAFETLGIMVGAGLVWEVLYHLIQRSRREGDWPPLLALVAGAPEAVGVWLLLHVLGVTQGALGLSSSDVPMFLIGFGTTWVLLWVAMVGPMRVVSIRFHLTGMELWRPGGSRAARGPRIAPLARVGESPERPGRRVPGPAGQPAWDRSRKRGARGHQVPAGASPS